MKIGKTFDPSRFFNKDDDTADDITEGAVKLFYPASDATKVSYLPLGDNQYLEIEKVTEDPETGIEGEVIYNTTEIKFKLYKDTAWVEALFSFEEITP